jgi:hypothetical protein
VSISVITLQRASTECQTSEAAKRLRLHQADPIACGEKGTGSTIQYRPDSGKPSGKQEGTWQAQRNEAAGRILRLAEMRKQRLFERVQDTRTTEKQKNRPVLARYPAVYRPQHDRLPSTRTWVHF